MVRTNASQDTAISNVTPKALHTAQAHIKSTLCAHLSVSSKYNSWGFSAEGADLRACNNWALLLLLSPSPPARAGMLSIPTPHLDASEIAFWEVKHLAHKWIMINSGAEQWHFKKNDRLTYVLSVQMPGLTTVQLTTVRLRRMCPENGPWHHLSI